MEMLILGVVLWSGIHMVPVVWPDLRNRWVDKLGEMPFKGLFSIGIFVSIVLMVLGWQAMVGAEVLYDIYLYVSFPSLILLILGFILIAASNIKCNFRRIVRHPQLTGFSMWALAHLLMNGDVRGVILFGGLLCWAVLTILFINKRDGAFERPEKELPHKGVIAVAAGLVAFIALAKFHGYFTGVALVAGN